jgi:hypothetical protein
VNRFILFGVEILRDSVEFSVVLRDSRLAVHKTETKLDAGGYARLSIYKALWQRLKLSQRPTPANAH